MFGNLNTFRRENDSPRLAILYPLVPTSNTLDFFISPISLVSQEIGHVGIHVLFRVVRECDRSEVDANNCARLIYS